MPSPDNKYSQQPAYNEAFVPPGPPSYSEAVGVPKPLYPVPPSYPPHLQPTVPQPAVTAVPVVITVPVALGPAPAAVTCPNCNAKVTTKTKSVSTKGAHIACFLLCLFGCCLCSCIPYCMNSFSDIYHYCPACNAYIGMHKH